MNTNNDQYCYVYLKHKDNLINKTLIVPNDGYLKLIGVNDENLIFSNFNEDGIFELELSNILDISINALVNHNPNPDYILIEESVKITDNIYEVLFCDEKKLTTVICKIKIVGNIFCFVGDRVSIIRNIDNFKRYKQEDILNMINNEIKSNQFDSIKIVSYDQYKKNKELSLKTKFEEIISSIITDFNDTMLRNSRSSIISQTLFINYELLPNDKEIFILSGGFDIIKNILKNNGWTIEEIYFRNDSQILVIKIKI